MVLSEGSACWTSCWSWSHDGTVANLGEQSGSGVWLPRWHASDSVRESDLMAAAKSLRSCGTSARAAARRLVKSLVVSEGTGQRAAGSMLVPRAVMAVFHLLRSHWPRQRSASNATTKVT